MPLPTKLPSLNALRAFEATGRHLSFTHAADELSVTPAAVGQQVKALEAFLDTPLVLRQGRTLVLTAQGHALLPGLTDAFYRLNEAVEGLRRRDDDRPITLSVAPSFGAAWLLPRFNRFREWHPDIDVRIDATYRFVDLFREDVDVAIRYCQADDFRGMHTTMLLDEEVFPVASPERAAGNPPLSEPDDLSAHELLHVEGMASADYWPDWPMWLEAVGATRVDSRRGVRFTDTAMALQVAAQGRGVALGSRVLASNYLSTGALVKLFHHAFHVSYAYFVVSPPAIAGDPRIAALREWLAYEARTDLG